MNSARQLALFSVALVLAATAGCLTEDTASMEDNPTEAEPQAAERNTSWNLTNGTHMGVLAGVGTPVATTWVEDEDHCPSWTFTVPSDAEALLMRVEPEIVNTSKPGAGSFGVGLYGPGDEGGQQIHPFDPMRWNVSDPGSGEWQVSFVAVGAAINQAWYTELVVDGQGQPPADGLDLAPVSCSGPIPGDLGPS